MSAWATVLLTIVGMAGIIVVNLIVVSYYFGRKTNRYDAFGNRITQMESQVSRLLVMDADLKWIKSEIRFLGGNAPTNGGH